MCELYVRENACEQVTIGFDFTSDWFRKWHELFLNQSQGAVMQIQSDHNIIFDTQLKTAL